LTKSKNIFFSLFIWITSFNFCARHTKSFKRKNWNSSK